MPMKKPVVVWSTVVRPIRVAFDLSRRKDSDYLAEMEDAIVEAASKGFGCYPKGLVITESDISELID